MGFIGNFESINYKCPACSAVLKYDSETYKLKCDYCKNNYNLDELENESLYELATDNIIKVDEYICSDCGAKLITTSTTSATFCVYCGNVAIIKNRLKGVLKPNGIIPFNTTKEDAKRNFFSSKVGKIFAPKFFWEDENVEKITGIYVPFWLYDCKTIGEIRGFGFVEKILSRTIESKKYKLLRRGEINFKDISVDGSTNFDDSLMDSINDYNYTQIKEFDLRYLSGFLAEAYNINIVKAHERVEKMINKALKEIRFENYLKNHSKSYGAFYEELYYDRLDLEKMTIKNYIQNSKYILLPVWLLNVKYKNKIHTFAMNGQTGKFIGNYPIMWKKLLLTFCKYIIIIAITAFIIYYTPIAIISLENFFN